VDGESSHQGGCSEGIGAPVFGPSHAVVETIHGALDDGPTHGIVNEDAGPGHRLHGRWAMTEASGDAILE
jgi:hypothetical protein